MIVVPVVALTVAAVGVIISTTVGAVRMAREMAAYLMPGGAANSNRVQPFGTVLQVVEGYLLASILLIFALGLYELFIAKIDLIERSESAPRALLIRNIDDLKERLGRVVLLGLVIEFFQQSLRLQYGRPVELRYMAVGIALVGAALYVSRQRSLD